MNIEQAHKMLGRSFRVGGTDGVDALVAGVAYYLSGDTRFEVVCWKDGKRSSEWIGPAELGEEVVAAHPFGFKVSSGPTDSNGGAA